MKILVSGARGLVGSALCPQLTDAGHELSALTRRSTGEGDIVWDPASGEIPADSLEGFDTVVHLAGDNIAEGRWNEAKKNRIRDSRVDGTRLLCETLANLERKPSTLICASAIGYYGDRGDEKLVEETSLGSTFLAKVCEAWEAATEPAREAGIRVVNLRFGMILSPTGGALKNMLTPFRLGAGGRIGDGKQYWSWITLQDAVRSIDHAIHHEELSGPVNSVSPDPVTNEEFTKALGRVLKRPTIFPMPAFAAKLVFGEMADALILGSSRVYPQKLQATGFEFTSGDLETGLRSLLT